MAENILDTIIRGRIFGKSPTGAFLRANQWAWNKIPKSLLDRWPFRLYGHFLNALVRRYSERTQYFGTFFLRNRPQLELIGRLSYQVEHNSKLNIAVLGCSNGAEVYSILATLRRSRPELNVTLNAVDISADVLAIAEKGEYSIGSPELVGEVIFQRISEPELQSMFNRNGDRAIIQSWIREGISWHLGDVRDPKVLNKLGPQDIVVANNFLCHMRPFQAQECLLGILRLVRPGGYLVVSGIDLNVREEAALQQRWRPVTDLLEEVHDGDPALRKDWPFSYWGLEPFNKKVRNGEYRYASIFQIGEPAAGATSGSKPATEKSADASDAAKVV